MPALQVRKKIARSFSASREIILRVGTPRPAGGTIANRDIEGSPLRR